jgi:hypothetical protein
MANSIKEVPNILSIRCDNEEVVIENISNPMRIDEFNIKELFERDMFLMLEGIKAVWVNRPDELSDIDEGYWYRKIGKTFTYINEN